MRPEGRVKVAARLNVRFSNKLGLSISRHRKKASRPSRQLAFIYVR